MGFPIFALFIFMGVLMPIISVVILFGLQLLEKEVDYLELENTRVRLEKELQESEYYQLNQQIQPHFLFNSLNAFLSLSRLGKNQDMIDGMERFSLFLRYKYQNKQALIPFHAELGHTKNYLYIQNLRFGKRLTIEYDLDPQSIMAMLPPYTLQTFVENAFKHGLEKKIGEKHLKISIRREGNWVSLKVVDNCQDELAIINGTNHLGIGLSNIQKRFSLIFDLPTKIGLVKNEDGYTVAHAYWPFIPEGEENEGFTR